MRYVCVDSKVQAAFYPDKTLRGSVVRSVSYPSKSFIEELMKNQRLRIIATVLLSVSVLSGASILQAHSIDSLMNQAQQNTEALAAGQKRIKGIAEQTDKLTQDFQVVVKQVDGLKIYNAQQELQIADQEANIARLEQSIAEAATLDRDVAPFMDNMIEALDQFVDLDLPFLIDERKKRIEKLRANTSNSNLSAAERFRQVLEAYKIELNYGNGVEASTQNVNVDGVDLDVNILRIGRIAMMYQTKDQSVTAAWSKETGGWEKLSQGEYASAVSEGLRIANKQSPINIMTIPAAAPTEARR